MKPQASLEVPTDDLFRHRLDNLIDRRHELARLADLIDWERFDIARGKVPKRYEFGVKVSIATTSRSRLVVGAQSLPGNPHDAHTLKEALQPVKRLAGNKRSSCDY